MAEMRMEDKTKVLILLECSQLRNNWMHAAEVAGTLAAQEERPIRLILMNPWDGRLVYEVKKAQQLCREGQFIRALDDVSKKMAWNGNVSENEERKRKSAAFEVGEILKENGEKVDEVWFFTSSLGVGGAQVVGKLEKEIPDAQINVVTMQQEDEARKATFIRCCNDGSGRSVAVFGRMELWADMERVAEERQLGLAVGDKEPGAKAKRM